VHQLGLGRNRARAHEVSREAKHRCLASLDREAVERKGAEIETLPAPPSGPSPCASRHAPEWCSASDSGAGTQGRRAGPAGRNCARLSADPCGGHLKQL